MKNGRLINRIVLTVLFITVIVTVRVTIAEKPYWDAFTMVAFVLEWPAEEHISVSLVY